MTDDDRRQAPLADDVGRGKRDAEHKGQALHQQHGFFHAGTIGTIADNAAGYAAYSLMNAESSVLTVEFKLNLLAPGNGALLIARGHVIKPGRTLTVCQSDVFVRRNSEEKRCAVALITLIQLAGKPDSAPM